VVAAPVAWWIVNRWLQQFACRIPIYWCVFVVAFVIVMGITIGLVTLRSWHAANENPADVVKSE
jgi:putative ABC transport system permease protein